MQQKKITFEELCAKLRARAGQDDMPSIVSVPNLVSGLRGFTQELGHAWNEAVGSALRKDFRVQLDRHLEALRAEGRSARYIRNRKTYLGVWKQLVRKIDDEAAGLDGERTALQVALQELAANETVAKLARVCGVAPPTFRKWLQGSPLHFEKLTSLRRLEVEYELDEHALTDLLPYRAQANFRKSVDRPTTEYRQRLRILRLDRFRLKPAEILPDSALKEEWRLLLAHKTGRDAATAIPPGRRSLYREAQARAASSNGEQWRLKPLGPCDVATRASTCSSWTYVIGDQKCASAQTSFNHISDFFGWCRIDHDRGGQAIPVTSLTLGLLTDTDLVDSFLEWRIDRSGSINHGVINWLAFAKSICRADTGFLTRRPEIGERVGASSATDWTARCATAHAFLSRTLRALLPKVRHSRDPKETLKSSLENGLPVTDYLEGLRRIRARKPGAGGRNEAIWGRDAVLLGLAISNPLRETNLRELTYRADNSGQLRRSEKGWKIVISAEHFKNERFFKSAAEGNYEQDVHAALTPAIEKYVKIYRPLLLKGKESDVLFVSSRGNPYGEGQLSIRFQIVTLRWVPNCPGVGLHAMRHIMASTFILKTRGDYILAAKYLHDKPETVAKYYAHILERVADRGRTEVLGDIFLL